MDGRMVAPMDGCMNMIDDIDPYVTQRISISRVPGQNGVSQA